MRREEITERLRAFERDHPVGDYRWRGFRAWPVLRTGLSLALHQEGAEPSRGLARRLQAKLSSARARVEDQALDWWTRLRGPAARSSTVLLTYGSRAQPVEGRFVNALSDPFADELERAGESVQLWEVERSRFPHHRPRSFLESALHGHVSRFRKTAPHEPAPWLGTFLRAFGSEFGTSVSEQRAIRLLDGVAGAASFFQPRFEAAGTTRLLLDTWYGWRSLGACVAAHRCGAEVVDIQHGLQGSGHFAYSGWAVRPESGFEAMPDRYWVWGQWDAESLVRENPEVIRRQDVRVVGNPWLNSWRDASNPRWASSLRAAQALVDGASRVILVTLQAGIPYRERLLPLLENSPNNWRWLLRLHRRMDVSPRALASELGARCAASIEVEQASTMPLYALFRAADLHVTWFSTCAIEALAFGLPTLLLHPSGGNAFSQFIGEGVMYEAATDAEALAYLASEPPAPETCVASADAVFARKPEPGATLV